jgi:hypothetical protein
MLCAAVAAISLPVHARRVVAPPLALLYAVNTQRRSYNALRSGIGANRRTCLLVKGDLGAADMRATTASKTIRLTNNQLRLPRPQRRRPRSRDRGLAVDNGTKFLRALIYAR